ncbi:MAG TPA: flagellar biosynthesis protein FlhF [Desulfuromonadales bacterium]|nr:flagellar biosynthesis protein FlhF [Desulfuromonadales bacterium]
MLVKTFQAPSMAEALRMVKAELGPDAMILSTKKEATDGVLGMFSKPVYRVTAAIDPTHRPAAPVAAPVVRREAPVRELTAREEMENSMLAPLARELKGLRDMVDALARREEESRAAAKAAREAETAEQPGSGINFSNIPRADLDNIKKLLLATLAKSREGGDQVEQVALEPTAPESRGKTEITVTKLMPEISPLAQELADSGIASARIGTILDTIRMMPNQNVNTTDKGRLGDAFSHLISFAGTLKLKQNTPRVIALVGPTGVGKTTTTAKLAAMHALNHGNRVALITMDIFRVGAVEQLKTYSRIMGIPLEVASTPRELEKAFEKHSNCDLIFIDTAGRSHKDKEKLDEMRTFLENKIPIDVYLCLSATTKDRELEEILHRFSIFQISKLVFTKIDECESFGNVVNLLMKDNLPIAYFTTGQRVPEDIEVATPEKLADMFIREEAA